MSYISADKRKELIEFLQAMLGTRYGEIIIMEITNEHPTWFQV